ncbi:ankyrin repeat domain-containing protein [Desulfofalx alkaliphila]|uniref:ankyrin repeat domain-containing protein n=1 Tax=Desulfofalx alkaliphila TaxID=105483 RepID=UPI0004E0E734|nr:ankyrin repeat domain-containing protein [Desulfofalx alkaliphila]
MIRVSNKIAIYIIYITVFILLSGCKARTQSNALSQLHDKGIININEDSLIEAVKNGDAESVKLLLELGIDTNIEIKNGLTPLMIAAERGDIEVVKLLVNNEQR